MEAVLRSPNFRGNDLKNNAIQSRCFLYLEGGTEEQKKYLFSEKISDVITQIKSWKNLDFLQP